MTCDSTEYNGRHWSPRAEVYERIQQMIDATLEGSDLATTDDLSSIESDLREEVEGAVREARDAERMADNACRLAEDAKTAASWNDPQG